MNDKQIYKTIKDIVIEVLHDNGVLKGNWRLGKVDTVISDKKLTVFVDGNIRSQTISCNPDITFVSGDYVWIVNINGSSQDKFVISKRAV